MGVFTRLKELPTKIQLRVFKFLPCQIQRFMVTGRFRQPLIVTEKHFQCWEYGVRNYYLKPRDSFWKCSCDTIQFIFNFMLSLLEEQNEIGKRLLLDFNDCYRVMYVVVNKDDEKQQVALWNDCTKLVNLVSLRTCMIMSNLCYQNFVGRNFMIPNHSQFNV